MVALWELLVRVAKSKVKHSWDSCLLSSFTVRSLILRVFVPPLPYLSQHFLHHFTSFISANSFIFSFFTTKLGTKPGITFGVRLMGSHKEERGVIHDKSKKFVKTCIVCLFSVSVSIIGGLLLVWWVIEYHPTNSQQWMVPFGLILFGTPVIVWFSVFLSGICNPNQVHVSSPDQPIVLQGNPVHDPER